ncbi:MAG: SGNH family hydrolase [Pseudomonadota bacterium]
MTRTFYIVLLLFLSIAVGTPQIPVIGTFVGVETAQAQQKKRKTLFDILFKRRKKNVRKSSKRSNRLSNLPGVRLTTRQRQTKPATRQVSAPQPAVVVEKRENAAKILVVGDFIASGLASGLEKLYADNSSFVIVKDTSASSGIVRDDVVDWPARVAELIQEVRPIAIVSLVGMNDRQQMRLETGRVDKLSDPWKAEYKNRITKIVTSGQASSIPVIWVGLPPVKSNKMNADYLVFNEMARSISESIGGTFVDVWDGFTNAEGKFVSAGPDINGQIARLRGSKGINMTRAGKAKLAFFADKALRKIGIVGNPEGFEYASLGTINPNLAQPGVPEYDPAKSGKTAVLSLGSPTLDGGDGLDGEADFLKSENKKSSVSFELVENGLPEVPKPGRVDAGWGAPANVEAETNATDTKTNANTPANPENPAPETTVQAN